MAAKPNGKRTSLSRKSIRVVSSARLPKMAALSDEDLLETVQRQSFNFFWEGAHPQSGLAFDGCTARRDRTNHKTTVGGSGFGVMAIIVAVERGWITREAARDRLGRILDVLTAATVYSGAFAHFLDGRPGATIPFSRKGDGRGLVETPVLRTGVCGVR